MIIETITVKNFLSHCETSIDFRDSRLWLVCGENGAGKSALFDAVEYALYGRHRGGGLDAKLLVKQGTENALVQVTIRLGNERYRITRHLRYTSDNISGNRGGFVEEWRDDPARWERVPVGDGVLAAWKWLESRVPDHRLFRSAIFLRQGETAHFLTGYRASGRMKLFAEMIGLDHYTRIAERARVRSDTFGQLRRDAEVRLSQLGDVSDEALQSAHDALGEAICAAEIAQGAYKDAQAVTKGAAECQRLHDDRERLEGEFAKVKALLGDEQQILEDHIRVCAWDGAAERLGAWWRARDDAVRKHDDATKARGEAAKAEETREQYAADLEVAKNRRRVLTEDEIPESERRRDAAARRSVDLKLESDIARSLQAAAVAEELKKQHSGADAALRQWNTRREALPHLRRLAHARSDMTLSGCALKDARAAQKEAIAEATAAAEELAKVTAAVEEKLGEAEAAGDEVSAMEQDSALLRGRIESHSRVEDEPPECPVCSRPLDEGTREHVQRVLAEERRRLTDLEGSLLDARKAQKAGRAAVREAERLLEQARTRERAAQAGAVGAEQGVKGAAQASETAKNALHSARRELGAYGDYTEMLETVTVARVDEEHTRVTQALGQAEAAAASLRQAHEQRAGADAALGALRDRRQQDAEPLGETLPTVALQEQAKAADSEVETIRVRLSELNAEATTLQGRITTLTGEIAAAEERTRGAAKLASEAEQKAAAHQRDAERLSEALGTAWEFVLDSREAYEAERQEVEQCRPSADRMARLSGARGELKRIVEQLGRNEAALTEIPDGHRISFEEAQERSEAAYDLAQTANAEKVRAEGGLQGLIQRRDKAADERCTIDQAAEEADTYDTLADILKEGGPVQNAVAEQEQRAIAEEVNAVLHRLNDGLESRSSNPACRKRSGLAD